MENAKDKQRGGKREGAGRPTTGIERRAYSFRLTVEEHTQVKEFIRRLHLISKNPVTEYTLEIDNASGEKV